MDFTISPSVVSGTIDAPPSKSLAQRYIALASLAKGKSIINNIGYSQDVNVVKKICESLGAKIAEKGNTIIVQGGLNPKTSSIHCDESGLAFRMFCSIASLFNSEITLSGSGTLLNRNMKNVCDALSSAGIAYKSNNNFLPITVQGPLKGGTIEIDGTDSSQVLTGLLLAAPFAQSDVEIKVNNLQSQPYVDLTIDAMKSFGVIVENNDNKLFRISCKSRYVPSNVEVEGDWSGAAFLLVAGAIAGNVTIKNLSPFSSQPDKGILSALMNAGSKLSINADYIEVQKHTLRPFSFDATHSPDLFPPLVALASHCEGESIIIGANRLKNKESNRALTLQSEFAKMGVKIVVEGDVMVINGGKVNGCVVSSHNDHRIAMATAVSALGAKEKTVIQNAESVNKSFPNFWEIVATW